MTPELSPDARALRSTLLALVLVAFVLIGYLMYRVVGFAGVPAVEPRAITPRGELFDEEKANVELFRQSAPSVVFITTLTRRYNMLMQPVDLPGTGSGFIWDDAGDIVTNFHVIREATAGAKVTLSNHKTYDAQFVGAAPEFDLAVIRIKAPKAELAKILIGSSSDLQVGQKVFAIGNPFGFDQTLTTGIVSATGRRIEGIAGPIEDAIQTDAAINPGNSGGPLLDSAGRLIGVNTAIYSKSGSSAGIGFAVPVDTVNRIVPQLIESGRAIRPRLALSFGNPAINQAFVQQRLGLEGVLILGVEPNSAADKAGLRGTDRDVNGRVVPGDVIMEIEGRAVKNVSDLHAALGRYKVGDRVTVTVNRLGETIKVLVALEAPQDAK